VDLVCLISQSSYRRLGLIKDCLVVAVILAKVYRDRLVILHKDFLVRLVIRVKVCLVMVIRLSL
jgi:hypothetical protein